MEAAARCPEEEPPRVEKALRNGVLLRRLDECEKNSAQGKKYTR